MKIDRQRFLSLVLGMSSPLVGCGGATTAAPARTTTTTTTVSVGAPTAQCVDWSPSGDCLAYGQVGSPVVVSPVAEGYAPTGECYGWDSNGTCTEWVPDYAPTVECTQYDPSGECVSWS